MTEPVDDWEQRLDEEEEKERNQKLEKETQQQKSISSLPPISSPSPTTTTQQISKSVSPREETPIILTSLSTSSNAPSTTSTPFQQSISTTPGGDSSGSGSDDDGDDLDDDELSSVTQNGGGKQNSIEYNGAAMDDFEDKKPGMEEKPQESIYESNFMRSCEIVASPLLPVIIEISALAKLSVENVLIDRNHGLQTLHAIWNAEQTLKLLLMHEKKVIVLCVKELIQEIPQTGVHLCAVLLIHHIKHFLVSQSLRIEELNDLTEVDNYMKSIPSGYLILDVARVMEEERYKLLAKKSKDICHIVDIDLHFCSDRGFASLLLAIPTSKNPKMTSRNRKPLIFQPQSVLNVPCLPGTKTHSVSSFVISLVIRKLAEKEDIMLSVAFLFHHILTLSLPLEKRAIKANKSDSDERATKYLISAMEIIASALSSPLIELNENSAEWNWTKLSDLLDGRLFCFVYNEILKTRPSIDRLWHQFFKDLWEASTNIPLPFLFEIEEGQVLESISSAPSPSSVDVPTLLTVSSPFFVQSLKNCPISCTEQQETKTSPSSTLISTTTQLPYKEHHYHSTNPIASDEKPFRLKVRIMSFSFRKDGTAPKNVFCKVSISGGNQTGTKETTKKGMLPASWADEMLSFRFGRLGEVMLNVSVFGMNSNYSEEGTLIGDLKVKPANGKNYINESINGGYLRILTILSDKTYESQEWSGFLQRFSDSLVSRDSKARSIYLARSDGEGIDLFHTPYKCSAEGCNICKNVPNAVFIDKAKSNAEKDTTTNGKKVSEKRKNIKDKISHEQAKKEESMLLERLSAAKKSEPMESRDYENVLLSLSTAISSMNIKHSITKAKALEILIGGCFEWWKQCRAHNLGEQNESEAIPASLTSQLIQDAVRLYSPKLTPPTIIDYVKMLSLLPMFDKISHQLVCFYVLNCGLENPCPTVTNLFHKVKKIKSKASNSIFNDVVNFQLEYCGGLMHRCYGSKKDPRMPNFDPDSWQRKVLDAIDAEKSVLVVAATSLGKTSICYYTLQRMMKLREQSKRKERKIVVYIAPTKALANQVAADFYDRSRAFSSVTVGVFTRDYRYNEDKCDVLITVPEIFERLLLQPSIEFSSNLFYAIIDEVHSIQSSDNKEIEGGSSWEKIIRMCPCPMLALSATIGNPSAFHEWLCHVEQQKTGRSVELITFGKRFADTEFFVYAVNKDSQSTKVISDKFGNIKHLHPLAIMENIQQLDIAKSLCSATFSPKECFIAQQLLFKILSARHHQIPETINSHVPFFPLQRISDFESVDFKDILQQIKDFLLTLDPELFMKVCTFIKESQLGQFAEIRAVSEISTIIVKLTCSESLNLQTILFAFLESLRSCTPKSQSPFAPSYLDIEVFHANDQILQFVVSFIESNPQLFYELCETVKTHPLARFASDSSLSREAVFKSESFTLSPIESIIAIRVICRVIQKASPISQHPLQTTCFFEPWMIITRDLVYSYETHLKCLLSEVALTNIDAFRELCSRVSTDCSVSMLETSLHYSDEGQQLSKLLVELNTKHDLPAIVFMFSRHGCETEALKLGKMLRNNKEQSESRVQQKPEQQKHKVKKAKPERLENAKNADERIKLEKEREELREVVCTLINPDYSYAGKLPQSLAHWKDEHKIARLSQREKELVKLFDYGIGVHHAGLSRSYRNMVEIFFRAGHLRVCFATGTLALGINMPVRSVIFMHNSPFLTTLMFHQMKGRSGRRGIDNFGKCIFLNFTQNQIKDIILAKLRCLQGQFPMRLSDTLNLSITTTTGNLPLDYSLKFFNPTSICPLYAFVQGPKRRQQVMQQIEFLSRFSLEFLRKNQLIDEFGRPIGKADLVSYIAYHEPANFALNWLLLNGELQRICSGFKSDPNGTANKLLFFLCHFLNQAPLPYLLFRALKKRHKSKIILEDLPKIDKQALERYNRETLDVFTQCVLAMCSATKDQYMELNHSLPLSGITFINRNDNLQQCKTNVLHSEDIIKYYCRSPFVAISGKADVFQSALELSSTCMESARFDSVFIPTTQRNSDVMLRGASLNSYALDFFKHGDLEEISEVNSISGAWSLLNDWMLTLRSITASFKMDPTIDTTVLAAFEHLHTLWMQKFSRYTRSQL